LTLVSFMILHCDSNGLYVLNGVNGQLNWNQNFSGPVESDKLPSNDLDEQSDSDDDEESDNEDDEDEEHGRQNSWVCAQEVISSGQAAWEYFESQLEAVQGNQDGEQ
jgi:hypothetical protein